jgi:hypothetical protein
MKTALAAILLFSLTSALAAQSRQSQTAAPQQAASQPATDLNTLLTNLQRVALSANADIGKLRIEKWKADSSQKEQMQQVADSLQRNISSAIPGLIGDVQAAPGSVSRTFKLYHNINVVYEFLNSLAEAAGAFGKREEYEPLANDASSLDHIRQNLSDYIEQKAAVLENPPKPATQAQANQGPKKIVIDDSGPPPKKTRKKKATAASTPSSSSPPQQ